MAEGFLRHYGGEDIVVKSAGVSPDGVNPKTVEVMHEAGIDISGHTSDSLTEYLNESFDYVITVCDNAQRTCPPFPGGGERLHWSFEDPKGAAGSEDEVMDTFRRIRDQIKTRVQSWLADRTNHA